MGAVLIDFPSRQVARIRINRPAKRNAIDYDVREELFNALQSVHADRSVRALILGGVDGVFSAGGDLDTMSGLDEAGAGDRLSHIHRLCKALADSPLPIISAVEGFCAGAAVGMALLGDQIVVGADTKILFPFMGLGLVPDWGMMLTLPRRVGVSQARELMLFGGVTPGERACEIGLADVYCDGSDVMLEAIAQAERFVSLPAEAFSRFKSRLNHPSSDLEVELKREFTDQVALLQGSEFALGFDSFMNKKKPDFKTISRSLGKE